MIKNSIKASSTSKNANLTVTQRFTNYQERKILTMNTQGPVRRSRHMYNSQGKNMFSDSQSTFFQDH